MTDEAKKDLQKILDDIDRATLPEKMSPEDALEFLEEVQTHVEASIDGLKDDMAE